MASLWEQVSLRPERDVVRYDVAATDGTIGKIDEAAPDFDARDRNERERYGTSYGSLHR